MKILSEKNQDNMSSQERFFGHFTEVNSQIVAISYVQRRVTKCPGFLSESIPVLFVIPLRAGK
jgi:hypothetical protein